jgi:predicted Holliday junction resolvase-like endonuclease
MNISELQQEIHRVTAELQEQFGSDLSHRKITSQIKKLQSLDREYRQQLSAQVQQLLDKLKQDISNSIITIVNDSQIEALLTIKVTQIFVELFPNMPYDPIVMITTSKQGKY